MKGVNKMKQTRNSKPKVDLTGKTFGYLTPMYYIKGGKWHCKCKCGNELDVDTRNLNSGHTKSCGCYQKEMASKNTYDMSNYEDENIKVLEAAGSDNQQIALWKCICKHCGNIFVIRGSRIRNGATQSCGCVHSYNEKNIIKLLTDNNIEFASQYTFPDLIGLNGGRLRFDFAIFKNGKLSHLIEYNGLQHYEQAQCSWSEGFQILQEHDKMKQKYCKEHNIPLVIIKYNQQYDLNTLINL